eukprot:1154609-Pelagomonas_calceolata.AAC.1
MGKHNQVIFLRAEFALPVKDSAIIVAKLYLYGGRVSAIKGCCAKVVVRDIKVYKVVGLEPEALADRLLLKGKERKGLHSCICLQGLQGERLQSISATASLLIKGN